MSERRVHGVLVTYRRPDDLRSSLTVLAAQTRRLDHLVVVDNDPGSDLSEVVDGVVEPAAVVTLLAPGDNLGPAGGIGLGMSEALERAADEDLILVLDDDDPLVDDRVVADLVSAFDSAVAARPKLAGVGLHGARLDRRSGRLVRVHDGPYGYAASDYLKSNWAPMYLASAVRSVGVFRHDLFFGFDDLEFGLRLNRAGYATEVHELGRPEETPALPPSRGYRRTPWRTYYTVRNLLVLMWSHGARPAAVRTALLVGLGKPVYNLARFRPGARAQLIMSLRAIVDACTGRMGRRVEPDATK